MLWHRQAIFKSKGDRLCSSAESRIWTRDPRHQIASRLNARWQTHWAIEDQAKNLNSTARPYDQRTYIHTYIFVVVNFDTLAQASDFRIERRQLVFLCWEQDSNPGGLAIYIFVVVNFDALAQASDFRIERRQLVLHTYIHTYMFVVVNFDALAQASDIRI